MWTIIDKELWINFNSVDYKKNSIRNIFKKNISNNQIMLTIIDKGLWTNFNFVRQLSKYQNYKKK